MIPTISHSIDRWSQVAGRSSCVSPALIHPGGAQVQGLHREALGDWPWMAGQMAASWCFHGDLMVV